MHVLSNQKVQLLLFMLLRHTKVQVPRILNLDTRLRSIVYFKFRPLYLLKKGVGTNLVADWMNPIPSLEVMYNRKKSLDPPRIQNPDRPVSKLFAIPKMLPWIAPSNNFYF